MAYWKHWRKTHAEAMTEAMCVSTGSESEIHEEESRLTDCVATVADFPSSDTECADVPEYFSSTSNHDDTSYVDSDSVEHVEQTLDQQLASWAAHYRITRCALTSLLGILRNAGLALPKDARSVQKTPRSVISLEKCGGQYKYLGLEKGIQGALEKGACYQGDTVDLIVNVDGLPLYKSSCLELWPIMCSFGSCSPFVVAIYCGTGKPKCVNTYLEEFLEEYNSIHKSGITYMGKNLRVAFRAFVCDAPARSMLKGVKGHTAFHACERCTIVGTKKEHRTVFTSSVVCSVRTDEGFAKFQYPDHQMTQSPLINYNIPCVTSFSLDYMHLVCLGVVRRIMFFWKAGPRSCRLSHRQLTQLSDDLCAFRGRFPREFVRQPRSVFEIERWKATEFRSFLLYSGPVVLRKILDRSMYEAFMALSVAVTIMLESDFDRRSAYLSYARELLKFFVCTSRTLFGDAFVVYNVHSLIHLPDDVEHFGSSLDAVSAFRFENTLHKLKNLVRHGQNPLTQVCKRLNESDHVALERRDGGSSDMVKPLRESDSWFLLKSGDVACVKEYVVDGVVCDVASERLAENFFSSPCESKLFNIFFISKKKLKRMFVTKLEVERKVICFPYGDGYVLLPLLHETENI